MSVHSERQSVLRNTSGNASLKVHSRSGDSEDGAELFDLMPASDKYSPERVIEQIADDKTARLDFLREYFKLLKGILSQSEYFAIKEAFKTGADLREVCNKYSFNYNKIISEVRMKLLESATQVSDLVECSDWEHAYIFARVFVSSSSEISRDRECLESARATSFKSGNLDLRIKLAQLKREEHNTWSRGYEKGKYSALAHISKTVKLLKSLISMLEESKFKDIISVLDWANNPQESLEFVIKWVGALGHVIANIVDEIDAAQRY